MRKVLAAVSLVACTLLAAYSVAGAPTAGPSAAPRFTPVPPTSASAFETEADRAALSSRDRIRPPVGKWDAVPVAAGEAAALLEQLVMAERAVRDPIVTGRELAFMGHLQQLVYVRLIERADLRDAVFSAIPHDLRAAADLNIAAGANLYLFGPVGVTELPEWRIVSAPPISDLLTYYREAEAEFGVPWYYLAAINLIETRMGRIRGDSYAGAQGPMQFMPGTWAAYGQGDVNDARDAILAAGRYLRATGAPANIEAAIWMYNHDDEYVDAVMKYAAVMRANPSAFRGYYGWQVYFVTANGTFLLPEGWSKR
ncbi:MAG TPA: lytic transglycosylase domain-containing protein [Candidatus Limnocylindria bacterium]|nr:lytic transglycosylase domain-containing protein [Candidatus Limnocylindria bacterium]